MRYAKVVDNTKAIREVMKLSHSNSRRLADLTDVMVAASRRNDESVDWQEAKNELKRVGKL